MARELTPEERETVERMKNSRHFQLQPGLTDEEILAQSRFVDFGGGTVYNSVEDFLAAKRKERNEEKARKRKTDTIEEV